ncbi:Solute carrier family 22 member 6 [Chionoecetes opilio]|uniref:Solute carrier family 22 member 6 n=1 Tax=Chionoecetes opilio TaxID=41210 RepID=A0A8J4XYI7_CHIOP|nr:Solute carrier family 22 member 6 [Chionoecetes opilio]
MYPWAPFVIFGTGALLAGAGTFLLPETRGQGLPDTVANLEARQTKNSHEPISGLATLSAISVQDPDGGSVYFFPGYTDALRVNQPCPVVTCSLSTSPGRDAKVYESSLEASRTSPKGAKLLVGGRDAGQS